MAGWKYIRNEDGTRNISVFHDGEIHVTDDSNPHFKEIFDRLDADESVDNVIHLFAPEKTIRAQFATLSADVKIENGAVSWRGQPVASALSDYLVDLYSAGEVDYRPVVRFLERLAQNPNAHSREMLWSWISDRGLRLTDTGFIVAYKGVDPKGYSLNAGSGDFRNGQPVEGHILNQPGDVIEKDRTSVQFDPSQTCSFGLHVGTYEYARGFVGAVGKVFLVHVDPADWVSTPTDCGGEKGRVCRYYVVREVEEKSTELVEVASKTSGDIVTVNVADVEEAKEAFDRLNASTVTINVAKTDTRQNHLRQKRDANGRFIKKGK